MKIKRILSLIESLNDKELRQLLSYLNEEININQYSPEAQKAIESKDIEKIARLIEDGEIEETKDILMLRNNNNGYSVAHYLAKNSDKTGWVTNDKEILKLREKENGYSVAHYLAKNSDKNKWVTNDKDILTLQDTAGWSVAQELVSSSNITKWSTDDKDILMLQNEEGRSVAHELAEIHPTWTTKDSKILNLKDNYGVTVKDVLKNEGKI